MKHFIEYYLLPIILFILVIFAILGRLKINQLEEERQNKACPLRDYQIDITDSFTYIWDKGRLVDSIPFDKTNPFDKVFLKDNE